MSSADRRDLARQGLRHRLRHRLRPVLLGLLLATAASAALGVASLLDGGVGADTRLILASPALQPFPVGSSRVPLLVVSFTGRTACAVCAVVAVTAAVAAVALLRRTPGPAEDVA